MKKSILWAVALVAVVGGGARSEMKCPMQEGDCASKKAGMIDGRVKDMTKELNLTEDQQVKVKAALEKAMTEKCALMEDAQKRIEAVMESTQSDVRALLTPEQQAKFDSMKEGKKCCAMHGGEGHKCSTKKEKASCPFTSGEKSKK